MATDNSWRQPGRTSRRRRPPRPASARSRSCPKRLGLHWARRARRQPV